VESDCESDFTDTRENIPTWAKDGAKKRDGEIRLVLSPGSFPVWRSLFFYQCTDQIFFAPLRSQGTDYRARYILQKTVADIPPPCSPKSIYVLANLLNIRTLRNIALKNIKNKLSEDNIVEELFSCTTANEQQVVEMECELLFSKFKNKSTISRVEEKISSTPGNHLVHRARAFKLGLRAALDTKKGNHCHGSQAGTTEGVALRCTSSHCKGHGEPMSYSSAGHNLYCPRCDSLLMQCAGCGWIRWRVQPSCSSCNKRFV